MLMFVSVGRARRREKVTGFWDNSRLTAFEEVGRISNGKSACIRGSVGWTLKRDSSRETPVTSGAIGIRMVRHDC